MAFDTFIKIDGIEGESSDDKHAAWIEVISYDTGVNQKASTTASSAGGGSSERADFDNFTFTKQLDKSSPKLAQACAAGTHIDTITMEICRAGAEKVKYMEFIMTNCIISNYQVSGDGEDSFPIETIGINFGKIRWVYTVQKRAGGVSAGNIATGWNLERNSKA